MSPVRIVCVSDTHNHHDALRLPEGDVLVHAGDLSIMGRPDEIEAFARWLARQPFPHKVVIAGNHDWLFEKEGSKARAIPSSECPDATYLEDAGAAILGLRFRGSPWQPEFCRWAFNLDRREDLAAKWALIPADTDVPITHGPPRGLPDRTLAGDDAGCDAPAEAIGRRPRLKLHVFGHIHEGYGRRSLGSTTYVNASACTAGYKPIDPPVVIEIAPA